MNDRDRQALLDDRYFPIKELPDGRVLAVTQMLFTFALCVMRPNYYENTKDGIENGRETRFCYAKPTDAILALTNWDGNDDPPGSWVKQKGGGVDRLNPRLADDDFV